MPVSRRHFVVITSYSIHYTKLYDDRADVCEVREETLRDTRTIDVDARQNGGVSVRGWDRSDVHVRARVVVWADSEAEARSIASASYNFV